MTSEQADAAAATLIKAVGELSGGEDGELCVIVRGSITDGEVLWSWDWFWRPKTDKPENSA